MTSKEIVEEEWLRSVILPEIVKNGQLTDDPSEDQAGSFKLHSIEIKFIGNEEAFMLTSCYKARLDYEWRANQRKMLTLVIKKTPEISEETFDSVNFAALFSNEIKAYTNIMPIIKNFSKRVLNLPRYFYGDLQKNSATIILEDFNAGGWRMSKERFNLDLEHALVAVKYLANFHGVCYAFKNHDRRLFDDMIANLKESRYASSVLHPDWVIILKSSVDRVMTATRRLQPEVPPEFLERLYQLISDNYRYGKQRVQPVEPMATLCHGDYLRNNIAYRYDTKNSERPVDVLMFDLQTMRYSSPMMDLTVFLALSVFKEVRSQHFDEIFRVYCEQLTSTYEEHVGQKLPEYLSSENLLREYIRFLPYSIGVAASFLMTLVEPDEFSSEELLRRERETAEVEEEIMNRGGEVVDHELAHQAKELYELSTKHGVDFCEGFDL